jgi:hypothetical protein
MPLTKFRKENKDLKPWTIYIWEEGDIIKGSAKAVTDDGVDEIFHSGREVAKDDQWQKPNRKKDIYIAKSQTKTELQNTLNALKWYGKKVMGKNGVDEQKFRQMEMRTAVSAAGIYIDISNVLPVKKYPVKNITFDKAKELGLM